MIESLVFNRILRVIKTNINVLCRNQEPCHDYIPFPINEMLSETLRHLMYLLRFQFFISFPTRLTCNFYPAFKTEIKRYPPMSVPLSLAILVFSSLHRVLFFLLYSRLHETQFNSVYRKCENLREMQKRNINHFAGQNRTCIWLRGKSNMCGESNE